MSKYSYTLFLTALIIIITNIQYSNAKINYKTINNNTSTISPPTHAEKYGYGTLSIIFITLLALLGIVIMPCFNKTFYDSLLRVLTGLAIGTLLSDALLHMIPEILQLHGHNQDEHDEHAHEDDDHDHTDKIHVPDHVVKILVVMLALYLFWIFEILMHRLAGQKISQGHGHSHGHSHDNSVAASDLNMEVIVKSTNPLDSFATEEKNICKSKLKKLLYVKNLKTIKATAWIILSADVLHNFADGLAVGASFAHSLSLGLSTTIAVVCHEIPHELGNYAVLVQSGFTHFQALFFNLCSALTGIIGFYIGVSVGSNDEVSSFILAITAGMFIYIALVDLLPSVLAGEWNWRMFIVINIAILVGFLFMFLLVVFEDRINI